MDTISLKPLENAAGEYKKAAGSLREYAGTLHKIVEKAGVSGEQKQKITSCIDRITSQSRQLEQLSGSLEDIVSASSASMRSIDDSFSVPEYDTYGGEFGESRFENLEQHEELIPIHSA